MKRVLVVGGRGFMGQRVVRLLKEAVPEVEVLTAGRGSANDRAFDVLAPEDHYGSLQGFEVLINAVGPFTYDPRPVIRACIDQRVHYVDLAENEEFLMRTNLDSDASAIVPGCSSVPGLIQVFAQHFAGVAEITSVRAQLSIGTNNPSSATLLYSMLDPIGQGHAGGRWFDTTWFREHPGLAARRYGPYPGGVRRVKVGNRQVPMEFSFGFDRSAYTEMLWLLSSVIAGVPRPLLRAASSLGNLLAPLSRPFGTKVGILSLDALDSSKTVLDAVEIRAKSDGLDVPALPSVLAARRLLESPAPAGLHNLSELISPLKAQSFLTTSGFECLFSGSGK